MIIQCLVTVRIFSDGKRKLRTNSEMSEVPTVHLDNDGVQKLISDVITETMKKGQNEDCKIPLLLALTIILSS